MQFTTITPQTQIHNFKDLNPLSPTKETGNCLSFLESTIQTLENGNLTKKSFRVLSENELSNLRQERKKIEKKLESGTLSQDQIMFFKLNLEKNKVTELEHCFASKKKLLEETEKQLESAESTLRLKEQKSEELINGYEIVFRQKRKLEEENEKALAKVTRLESSEKDLTIQVVDLDKKVRQLEEESEETETALALYKSIEEKSQAFLHQTNKILSATQEILREKESQISYLEGILEEETTSKHRMETQLNQSLQKLEKYRQLILHLQQDQLRQSEQMNEILKDDKN